MTEREIQILSITCDNASNNDTMVTTLGDSESLPSFSGQENRTHCFAHVLNLIAKSLLKQFDPPKRKSNGNGNDDNDNLQAVVGGIEIEELEARLKDLEVSGIGGEVDDVDGLVDVTAAFSEEDRQRWQKDIKPVQMALAKA